MGKAEAPAREDRRGLTREAWWPVAHRTLARLLRFEWLVVAAAAPVLMFPAVRPTWTAAALSFLTVLWLLRWAVLGEAWPQTPFNAALLVFIVMIPVGIWASAYPAFTVPKATGLVLGVAAFRAAALAVEDRRTLTWAVVAFCLMGVGITAVGTLGMQDARKVDALSRLAARIPRVIKDLPGLRTAGVSPNQLAAVLALYLPFAAGLVAGWPFGDRRSLGSWLLLAVLSGFVVVIALLLALTQSRSGWIGGVGGLLALTTLGGLSSPQRWKRVGGAAVPIGVVVGLGGAVLWLDPRALGETILSEAGAAGAEELVGSVSLAGRAEIWTRALYAIQDFPFTGCGLGAFRRVVHVLYPLFRIPPNSDIGHAHNIFLQTGVDLGLPGLIAYLALLMVAMAVCWRLARLPAEDQEGSLVRPVALGLAAGLAGLHAYGLTDALALGSKPGVAFWYALGLMAGLAGVRASSGRVADE